MKWQFPELSELSIKVYKKMPPGLLLTLDFFHKTGETRVFRFSCSLLKGHFSPGSAFLQK